MHKDFNLFTKLYNKISVTIYGYENFVQKPCIIYVHGFKGFKDWGFVPYTAESLASKGFSVITFNFSHNGIGESKTEFTQPENFANNTFSLEIMELSELIDAYFFGFFGETSNSSVGLLGHSRGGAVTILTAKKRREIKAAAVWAPVSYVDRYTDRQKAEWEKNGFIEIPNSRTNQIMKLNLKVLHDIEENKEKKLNVQYAVKKYNRPLLIVHGEQDVSIPVDEGKSIYEWSNKNKTTLKIIPAAGHTFNTVHPFEGPGPQLLEALNETEKFFTNHLF